MSEDDFSGLQKKILGWLLVAVVGGNTGVILLNKNIVMRADPFTGADAKEMEDRIMAYIAFRERAHHLAIPPEPTRDRIRALEAQMKDLAPSYRPPTYKWYEGQK